jgi:hypothetical protein
VAEAEVTPLPERPPPLPELVRLTAEGLADTRFSPNELRALKAQTGRGLTDLIGPDADDADRFQTMAWLRLRRDGHPALDWNALGDLEIAMQAEPPDPTNAGSPTSSPPSAGSGG